MSATKNTTTKTAQTNRINPDVQSRFDEVFAAIKAVDPTLTFWKNQMLKEAHEYRKAQSLDGLNEILDRLAKHQKEMANIEAVAAEKARAAQEAEAVRLAVEAANKARQAPVKEGWAKALKASATWVQAQNEAGRQGQKAFEEAFNAAYQKMAVRVAEVSYDDAEAVQTLANDLQRLTASVYQHQQNWCITCGAPIVDLITPKNGKPFKPSYCREHVLVAKAIKAAEKAADSGALTSETIQALETDPQFSGVVVETKRNGEVVGASAVVRSRDDDEPKAAPEPELPVSGKKNAKGKRTADEAEDDALYAETEKIGSKR